MEVEGLLTWVSLEIFLAVSAISDRLDNFGGGGLPTIRKEKIPESSGKLQTF